METKKKQRRLRSRSPEGSGLGRPPDAGVPDVMEVCVNHPIPVCGVCGKGQFRPQFRQRAGESPGTRTTEVGREEEAGTPGTPRGCAVASTETQMHPLRKPHFC